MISRHSGYLYTVTLALPPRFIKTHFVLPPPLIIIFFIYTETNLAIQNLRIGIRIKKRI